MAHEHVVDCEMSVVEHAYEILVPHILAVLVVGLTLNEGEVVMVEERMVAAPVLIGWVCCLAEV